MSSYYFLSTLDVYAFGGRFDSLTSEQVVDVGVGFCACLSYGLYAVCHLRLIAPQAYA